jgi:hypothetical protein
MEHLEGKGGERVVALPRFQGGSTHLCRLKTASFWPQWQALICTGRTSGFMGSDKPSSLVTTLSNHTPYFEVVCWRDNEAAQNDDRVGYRWEPRLQTGSRGLIST